MKLSNQRGSITILVPLTIIALALFFLFAWLAPFKDQFLNKTYPKPNTRAATSYSPKVLLLIYNPILENQGGQRLIAYKGWNDPRQLSASLVTDFTTASSQLVNYNIVETVELDQIPVKNDGFQYDDDTYLNCVNSGGSQCHNPDGASYISMLNAVDACGKRNRGEVDEVWIWGGPWFGFWESNLAGPNAFWYNSSPTTGTTCEKLLPIMGFNYERGQAEAMESYGHRTESTMVNVYGSWDRQLTHSWNKFSMLDVDLPGQGGCGNAHLAVNASSNTGYDTTNSRTVTSSCEDFLNYPNLTGAITNLNCTAWGCTTLGYFNWWYSHMPKAVGRGADGKLNNWWAYIVDPENTIANPVLDTANNPGVTNNIVSYWKMDEDGGTVVSDKYNVALGTAIGATTNASKNGFNLARVFDGSSNSRIEVGSKSYFERQVFSISAWVNRAGQCGPFNTCEIFSKGQSANTGYALIVSTSGDANYRARLSIRDGLQDVPGTTIIAPNTWYHLVATVDGARVKLYVNGVLEADVAQTVAPNFGTEIPKIGTGNSNNDLTMNGLIDEVAFWARVLSADEVSQVYNNGSGLDLTYIPPAPSPSPVPTPSPSPAPSPSPIPSPTPDVTAPTVSIVSPANGSKVARNSNTTISVSASDPSGVAKVEVYINNTLLCTRTAAPYSCNWKVPAKTGVTYTIKATAFDTASNQASATSGVTSANSASAPTSTSTKSR